MAKAGAANSSSPDPLKAVADALDKAVKKAKSGAADAKAATGKALPAAGRFLSWCVYNTSYVLSYGVVFPAVVIAKSIPANNAVVHGFVDGARAASETVDQWKHRQLEPPAKSRPSPAKSTPAARPKSSRRKRKTAG